MTHTSNDTLPDPDVLAEMREFFAAGYFEIPDASPMIRSSRAVRRRFENRTPEQYAGQCLYPIGKILHADAADSNRIIDPENSFNGNYLPWKVDQALETADERQRETLLALRHALDAEATCNNVITSPHTVGGRGYTHSIPNFGRVIAEGLDEHARRIATGLADARKQDDSQRIDFYLGLEDVLVGIRTWHGHLLESLETWAAADDVQARNRDRLVEALNHVPFRPARSFFEALVAFNFTYYLDDCDNPGRLERVLWPYYEKDLAAGVIDHSQALDLMRQFVDNVCDNYGWSQAIGGSNADGTPAYNELTTICIEASHGKFRPSLELCVRDDMPDELWDTSMDALASGSGQPAFYNERAYTDGLRKLDMGVSDEDLVMWSGGGCTETMIHGCSNVGSLDAGINLPLILAGTLDEQLVKPGVTLGDITEAFKRDAAAAISEVLTQVSQWQQVRAETSPQPMRSLLIDDCIDSGLEFNNRGARYRWSVINVAAIANIADSLAALKQVVFDEEVVSASQMHAILAGNFDQHEEVQQRLLACPKFGNGLAEVDTIAADIAEFVYGEVLSHTPWHGGRFLPSCVMFETYTSAGLGVGATPDGRKAGGPVADSVGPMQGKDTNGPTAMLRSVTSLPLDLAVGTPVLNVRFSKDMLTSTDGRDAVRRLIETYFEMGGLQMQISVLDCEELLDAVANPEQHEDLIVRIGGYSTHFNWLSDELKHEVIRRTEYAGG